MGNDNKIILTKIETAFSSLDQIQEIFSQNTLADILYRDNDRGKRVERFFNYCTSAKLLSSHLLGIFAAYFSGHIDEMANISSLISMIQGNFNNHLFLDASKLDANHSSEHYATTIASVQNLDKSINRLKNSLLNAARL